MLATSIASPFAGMIGKFVMHPVDTIKSKVQVNRMQLKSVSDYKSGTVTRLSSYLPIQSNRHTETKVLQDFSEEYQSQSLERLLLLLFTCQRINIQNTI